MISLTRIERIDVQALDRLLNHIDGGGIVRIKNDTKILSTESVSRLRDLRYVVNVHDGTQQITYIESTPYARLKASSVPRYTSLGTIDVDIRHYLAGKYYVDIDMCSAHLSILQHEARKLQLYCPELDRFCQNPALFASELDITKHKILEQLFNEKLYLKQGPIMEIHRFAYHQFLPQIQEDIEAHNLGSYLSRFLQWKEKECLFKLVSDLEASQFQVDILEHDGCYVRIPEDDPSFRDRIERFVDAYEYPKIKIKRHEPYVEFVNKLEPVFKQEVDMDSGHGKHITASVREEFDVAKAAQILQFRKNPQFRARYPHDLDKHLNKIESVLKHAPTGKYVAKYRTMSVGGYGRLVSTNSLTTIKGELRNYLMGGLVQEIDMSNAGPTLLSHILSNYNLECPSLDYYNAHRAIVLQEYGLDKEKIIGMFGSKYVKDAPPIISKIHEKIWGKHGLVSELQRSYKNLLQTIQIKKEEEGVKDPEVSALQSLYSHIIFTEERKVLSAAVEYTSRKLSAVKGLVYDGFYIPKSITVSDTFLAHLSDYVFKTTNIRMNFKVKSLSQSGLVDFFASQSQIEGGVDKMEGGVDKMEECEVEGTECDEDDLDEVDYTSYLAMKKEVEKRFFVLLSEKALYQQHPRLGFVKYTANEVKFMLGTYQYSSKDGKKYPFFPRWLSDKSRREHDKFVWVPGSHNVDPKDINIYPEFPTLSDAIPGEVYDHSPPVVDLELIENLKNEAWVSAQPLWYMFKILLWAISAGEPESYEYLMSFLSHLVLRPWEKPSTAIVVCGKQGCGKTKVSEMMQSLIGDELHSTVNKLENDLVSRFNELVVKSLFISFEEVDAKEAIQHLPVIKHLVKNNMMMQEGKFQNKQKVRTYFRCYLSSNEMATIKIDRNERSFCYMHASDLLLQNKIFFSIFDIKRADGAELQSVMRHLRAYEKGHEFMKMGIPTSEIMEQAEFQSRSPMLSFCLNLCNNARATVEGFKEYVVRKGDIKVVDNCTDAKGYVNQLTYNEMVKSLAEKKLVLSSDYLYDLWVKEYGDGTKPGAFNKRFKVCGGTDYVEVNKAISVLARNYKNLTCINFGAIEHLLEKGVEGEENHHRKRVKLAHN